MTAALASIRMHKSSTSSIHLRAGTPTRCEWVQAQLKRRPAVQSALRAQHFFHNTDGRAGEYKHRLLIPDAVFPDGGAQIGEIGWYPPTRDVVREWSGSALYDLDGSGRIVDLYRAVPIGVASPRDLRIPARRSAAAAVGDAVSSFSVETGAGAEVPGADRDQPCHCHRAGAS